MDKIQIKVITDPQNINLQQVEILFNNMYAEMLQQGLALSLNENGSTLWLESVKRMVNRMGILLIATKGDEVVGFAQASLKFAPDYLGSVKIGFINHVFVLPELRKEGVGKKLINLLIKLLKEKEIHSVELQVLSKNSIGRKFWNEMGFKEELLQMRKLN